MIPLSKNCNCLSEIASSCPQSFFRTTPLSKRWAY